MSAGPLLLAAFEPFGGEPVNPAAEVARVLSAPRQQLVSCLLPVDARRVWPAIDDALARHRPAAVLALGQAAGRDRVELECLAHNRLVFGEAEDNGGRRGIDEPLDAQGPAQLPCRLPVEQFVQALASAGHPVRASRDAGRFLCNGLLYHLLLRHGDTPALFVHLPLLPEQAQRRGRGEPSLTLEQGRAAVDALLNLLEAHGTGARTLGPDVRR